MPTSLRSYRRYWACSSSPCSCSCCGLPTTGACRAGRSRCFSSSTRSPHSPPSSPAAPCTRAWRSPCASSCRPCSSGASSAPGSARWESRARSSAGCSTAANPQTSSTERLPAGVPHQVLHARGHAGAGRARESADRAARPDRLIYRSFTVGVLPGLDRIGLPSISRRRYFRAACWWRCCSPPSSSPTSSSRASGAGCSARWARCSASLPAGSVPHQRDVAKCTDCGKCGGTARGLRPGPGLRSPSASCASTASRTARRTPCLPAHAARSRRTGSTSAGAAWSGRGRHRGPAPAGAKPASGLTLPTAAHPAPGRADEEEFLGRCIKCGACMKVCPTGVLQPALLEAGSRGCGHLSGHRIGYCEHSCVLCCQVCPTGAIRSSASPRRSASRPTRSRSAWAPPFRLRPLPALGHDTTCIVCEEVCPTSPKAIYFKLEQVAGRDGNPLELQPYVDPSLCTGCGICENRCPVFDRRQSG